MKASYKDVITINPEIRGGRPCVRGMRITVYDILSWLGSGMSKQEVIADYPEAYDPGGEVLVLEEPAQGLGMEEDDIPRLELLPLGEQLGVIFKPQVLDLKAVK